MKKTACADFEKVLNSIHDQGITTKDALMANEALCADFWLASRDFARFALLSRNGKTARDGRRLCGNTAKVDFLESLGVTTREDLLMDCVTRIVEKADLVLAKPTVAYMRNYVYSIVNSVVNTLLRKQSAQNLRFVSLDGVVDAARSAEEDGYTYLDVIADDTYAPERLHLERESVLELQARLEAKRAGARDALLSEVSALASRPPEALARLGLTHLGMKPREMTALLLEKGCQTACDQVIAQAARVNRIEPLRLSALLDASKLTADAFKADTNDPEAVAGQLSRLAYRAGKRLGK